MRSTTTPTSACCLTSTAEARGGQREANVTAAANAVVNPAARHAKGSPVYGIPIVNVAHSHSDRVQAIDGDGQSSLGHDLGVAAGVGRALPRWWHLAPRVGLEVGREWLTTKLSDAGVAASRSWNGPFGRLEIFVDLMSGGPWSLGPAVGMDAGFFTHFDLETPAGHNSGSTDSAIHAWPTVSFRVGWRL